MKKFLLSMAITAGFAGSALAADLGRAPIYKAPAPVAVANWTGCYIGAGGGYGMFNQDHRTLDPAGIPFAGQAGTVTTGGRGWFGTVQAGATTSSRSAGSSARSATGTSVRSRAT